MWLRGLYEKYPDIASFAAASPEEIEKIIRPCGLGKSKARDICACMCMLHEQYNDKVPDSMEELLKLPGVGREECQSYYGRCFRKAGNCYRYTLHKAL